MQSAVEIKPISQCKSIPIMIEVKIRPSRRRVIMKHLAAPSCCGSPPGRPRSELSLHFTKAPTRERLFLAHRTSKR